MKLICTFSFLLVLFTGIVGYSQTNQWAWVTGDSTANALAIHGQLSISSPSNKPAGKFGAHYWRDKMGNIWLFGGKESTAVYPYANYRSDLWKFNISTNNWTWVKGDSDIRVQGVYGVKGVASITNKPGARVSGNYWTDTAGKFWMFGGLIPETSSLLSIVNELWEYDTSTDMWTWVSGNRPGFYSQLGVYGTRGVPSPANYPGARSNSSSCVDKAGNLWLYGGNGITTGVGSGYLSDLWMFNTSTREWTWIAGDTLTNLQPLYAAKGTPCSNCYPGSRQYSTIAIDSNYLWLFAGEVHPRSTGYGRKNDIWKYDLSNDQWTWLKGDTSMDAFGNYGSLKQSSITNNPGSRAAAESWADSYGNLWIFGGLGFTATSAGTLGDMWKFNTISSEWTWMSGDSIILNYGIFQSKGLSPNNKAGGRGVGCSFVDQNGFFWMGGGQGFASTNYGRLNDFWYYIPEYSVMPVHLVKFVGCLNNMHAQLSWIANNELQFSHFEIERSTNSREFTKVGSVNSKGGSGKHEYRYDDDVNGEWAIVNGQNSLFTTNHSLFYRLKMIDNNGKYAYSNIIEIKFPPKNGFTVYPNPATTSVQLQFGKIISGTVSLIITDAIGKTVFTKTTDVKASNLIISTKNFLAGIYCIKVIGDNDTFTQQLVVSK